MKPRRPARPAKPDRKHPETARDTMEDLKDLAGEPQPARNEIRYVGANRDRALGEADRTGRHYDEEEEDERVNEAATDEGSAASKDHEAD